jgi:hypothetical protein
LEELRMLSLARYEGEAAMARAAWEAATDGDTRFALQQAWGEIFTAGRHRLLADRRAQEAAAARQTGLTMPRGPRADAWLTRAAELTAQSERHRAAADTCYGRGQELLAQQEAGPGRSDGQSAPAQSPSAAGAGGGPE